MSLSSVFSIPGKHLFIQRNVVCESMQLTSLSHYISEVVGDASPEIIDFVIRV